MPSTRSIFSVVQCDMTSDASLEAASKHLTTTETRIDALVNNAGAQFDKDASPDSAASLRRVFNESWDVNVTGANILTALVAHLLVKSADPRLLFLTSGAASLAETFRTDGPMFARLNASPEDKGWPKTGGSLGGGGRAALPSAYKSVKVGLNMVMREWARVLKADGVKVWSISPGFLATGLGGHGAGNLKSVSQQSSFDYYSLLKAKSASTTMVLTLIDWFTGRCQGTPRGRRVHP